MNCFPSSLLDKAADALVADQMFVKAGETMVITADTATDSACANAIFGAAYRCGARPIILCFPQLPFQGALADPYVPEPLPTTVKQCDVWIDLCFPYLAGSHTHDEAMKTNRPRYLLCADASAGSLIRLYGKADLDALFRVQMHFDRMMSEAVGKQCRITTKQGMDVTFSIAKPGYEKLRRANKPGLNVPPGSGMIYPEPKSVRGTVVIEAVFHEYYTPSMQPMRLEVDGRIKELDGGGPERKVMHRALKRAGGGQYGYVIHFTYGFHPAAQAHDSLIEDIRVAGNNAIGFGLPWWEPGGGENHPDGIASMQSIWLDGEPIVEDGILVNPPELAEVAASLEPKYA
jgi:leucyl aminopeptidase (aminopeptidase T)